MEKLKLGLRSADLPNILRISEVSEDLFEELADDADVKAELLDGVMIVHMSATTQHDAVMSFLGGLLGFYADNYELGVVLAGGSALFHLATCRRFAADVYFVNKGRMPSPFPKVFEGPPDLVMEVLPPSTRKYDLGEKRQAYQEGGIQEIWFVDLEKQELRIDRKKRVVMCRK